MYAPCVTRALCTSLIASLSLQYLQGARLAPHYAIVNMNQMVSRPVAQRAYLWALQRSITFMPLRCTDTDEHGAPRAADHQLRPLSI
jgi:hypothetical protein